MPDAALRGALGFHLFCLLARGAAVSPAEEPRSWSIPQLVEVSSLGVRPVGRGLPCVEAKSRIGLANPSVAMRD